MKTDFFESISLEDTKKVKLMNRVDRKYWFHIDQVEELFTNLYNDYYILDIDGVKEMQYASTYFDSIKDIMFTTHHNGKLNRYKIRKRSYLDSGISFLEVKHKINKGRTIKKRIPTESDSVNLNTHEMEFIENYSPYHAQDLSISLNNQFTRITLVSKDFNERCTMDFDLQYNVKGHEIKLDELVIVEVKADSILAKSTMVKVLKNMRIKSKGFSKYCIGRSLTDPNIKINAFKERIRFIEKVLHRENILLNIKK